MSQAQIRSLEKYIALMDMNASAHAFRAGVELGIFEVLKSGQKNAEQIAEACGLKGEPAEILLETLCRLEVLERYGDDYALAQVMRLLPDEFADLGDRYWRHLADFVRSGRSIPKEHGPNHDDTDFPNEAIASEWMLTPSAIDLIHVLDIGKSRVGLNVLELSAGSAIWSLTLAHRDPAAKITIVDYPELIQNAQSHAQSVGVADRLTAIAGDYRTVELPAAAYDLVILANVLHQASDAENAATLRRGFEALKPNGELAVIDVFPDQKGGELHYELFRLNVALRTEGGRVYSPQQVTRMIADAGFTQARFAHLPSPPLVRGLLLAERPSATPKA